MKKNRILIILLALSILVLQACSNETKKDDKKVDQKTEEKDQTNDAKKDAEKEDPKSKEEVKEEKKQEKDPKKAEELKAKRDKLVKEFDPQKFINKMYQNDEKLPFSYNQTETNGLKNGKYDRYYEVEGFHTFDGKTAVSTKKQVKSGGEVTNYKEIKESSTTTYVYMVDKDGKEEITKTTLNLPITSEGMFLVSPAGDGKNYWKLDEKESTDTVLVYKEELKDSQLEGYLSTQGFKLTEVKGQIKNQLNIDVESGLPVEFMAAMDYKGKLTLQEGGGITIGFESGPIEMINKRHFTDFKFGKDRVEKVTIPDMVIKNAKEQKIQ